MLSTNSTILWYSLLTRGLATVAFLVTLHYHAYAQLPQAYFTLPTQACLQQKIQLTSQSVNANRVEWDFCQGDLSNAESAASVRSLAGNITTGIDVVFDGTDWYGFVTNQNSDNILRLDFGPDLNSTPTITDLGDIGGIIRRPTDIKIIYDNGNWYGFVYGLQTSMLSRIDFGNALSNSVTSPNPISAESLIAGAGATNGGFDMMHDGSTWVAVLTNNTTLRIVRLPTINSVPTGADIISAVNNPYANGMGDVVLVRSNAAYFGYVVAFANKTAQRLSFGATLFSTPTISDITSALPVAITPYGIAAGFDNNRQFIFVSTIEGNLVRIDLGDDLNNAPSNGVGLGNFSKLENTLKLCLIKDKSMWRAFSPSWSSTFLYRVNFANPTCNIPEIESSTEPLVQFSTAGPITVTLRAFGNDGVASEFSKQILIVGETAPQLTLTHSGACVEGLTSFAFSSAPSIITSVQWEFGDNNFSSDLAPTHQYSAPGNFNVKLSVTASNGCSNFSTKSVNMYGNPGADFTLPAQLICTNSDWTFTNTTAENQHAELQYQWFVEGALAGTARDLTHAFTTTGTKSIKLIVANPGCSDDITKTTSFVQEGPTINFTSSGHCEENEIEFAKDILSNVMNLSWSFGDGGASAEEDPKHIFAEPGVYPVSLTATSANGCNNSKTRLINVYSRPSPDFEVDAPPQSCTGTITPFQNTTSPPTDSDVTFWRWNFGDQNASSNILETQSGAHLYTTAGNYTVELKAKTDQGCEGVIQKQITIAPAPSADFTNTSACLGVPSTLTSTGADINSYYWETGTAYYTTKTIHHTFTSIGEQNVKLSVTGNNNCNTTVTRKLTVPVPLTPSFSVWKNCVGYEAEFKDNTSGADAVAWRQWNIGGAITENNEQVKYTPSKAEPLATTLTIKGTSGCVYSKRVDVSIWKAPVSKFTVTPASGAIPLQVEVDNTSEEASKFRWTFNDGTVTTSEAAEPSYSFNTIGEHFIELKASNNVGCESVSSKIIDAQTPTPDVEINLITLSQNPDKTLKVIITLRNNGNTIIRNLPVRIDLSGQLLLNETVEGPLNPDQQYNLVLGYGISKNQDLDFLCAETKLESDISTGGNRSCIQLEKTSLIISPYPNPATDVLNIEWIAGEAHQVSIMITDGFGKALLQKNIDATSGLNQHYFDVNDLKAGIYFLVINDGFTVKTQRILISPKN